MRIYLDNHTVARPSLQVEKEMTPFIREYWASLSSPYILAEEQFKRVEKAYSSLYALIGADEQDTILFCSSGAEAINHILFSTYFDYTRDNGKNHYVTSLVDIAPMIMGMNRFESLGIVTKLSPVDRCGRITKENLLKALSPRTAILSLSLANGLTGVIQPLEEISKLCRAREIILHVDVTYALTAPIFHLKELDVDFVTFDGDPLHAPRGCGALYMKSSTYLTPLIVGGNEQDGKRAGSVNVANLIGFGVAAKELMENRDLLSTECARLRDSFEDKIKEVLPDAHIFFQDVERVPNCTAIAFPGVFNEALLYLLSRKGVYATMGGGRMQNLAVLLKACGVEESQAYSSLSFAFSRNTTEEEVDRAVEIIAESVNQLRALSKGLV